jgi:hypothetical protein
MQYSILHNLLELLKMEMLLFLTSRFINLYRYIQQIVYWKKDMIIYEGM